MNILKCVFVMIALVIGLMLFPGCNAGRIPVPAQNMYNLPDAAAFLGGGHPMDGVNYCRNNQSSYTFPATLAAEDSIGVPYDELSVLTELLIDVDEKIYLGRYYSRGWIGTEATDYDEKYNMWVFNFNGDYGPEQEGGLETVLTTGGTFTTSRGLGMFASNSGGQNYGGSKSYSSLFHYNWPDVTHSLEGYYIHHWNPSVGMNITEGDSAHMRFHHLLPIPLGRLFTAYSRNTWGKPEYIGLLDEKLDEMSEINLGGEVTGMSYDSTAGQVYVAAGKTLYCYDLDLNQKWNSSSDYWEFADDIPVIADDGGVLGIMTGQLRRYEPDGTPGPEVLCFGHLRPVILNDGTIAVISESTLKYFDEDLNEVGEVSLPSGENSGSTYTRPPLVDANDNMALFRGLNLYIIDLDGNVIVQKTFDAIIKEVRLGPDHLFVALDYAIYRFPV